MTNDLNGKIAVDIEAFKKSLMEDDYDPFGLEGIFEADVALASHDEEYFKKKFDLYDDEIYSDDEKYDKMAKDTTSFYICVLNDNDSNKTLYINRLFNSWHLSETDWAAAEKTAKAKASLSTTCEQL